MRDAIAAKTSARDVPPTPKMFAHNACFIGSDQQQLICPLACVPAFNFFDAWAHTIPTLLRARTINNRPCRFFWRGANMSEQTNPSLLLPLILVVESSPLEAEQLRQVLSQAGYAVSVAQNGNECLQAARSNRPALVISSVTMPLMNGYALCRALKYDDALWNIPLILLSDLSEPDDIVEAINSGADAYIVKPYAESNLLSRIRALLNAPIERRRRDERREEVLDYGGKRFTIVGGGQQILNLLLSLHENTLQQNRELKAARSQLNQLNESLDRQVHERAVALRESEVRFRNLVETSSDWIWEVNAHGVYTYASPKIFDLLGYLPEEVIGKTPFDLMPADEAQRMAALFSANIAAGKGFVNVENACLHKDGHRVVLETSAAPIIDRAGDVRGYRG
ncbi:MAG TPA: response regulator, partial [bacterium]|nr:response regulator [bacterium]